VFQGEMFSFLGDVTDFGADEGDWLRCYRREMRCDFLEEFLGC
jgi:hypothetical protein